MTTEKSKVLNKNFHFTFLSFGKLNLTTIKVYIKNNVGSRLPKSIRGY